MGTRQTLDFTVKIGADNKILEAYLDAAFACFFTSALPNNQYAPPIIEELLYDLSISLRV